MKLVKIIRKSINMGIKNLTKFLRDTCPQVFEEIHISEYAYQKIAVDISLFLHRIKKGCASYGTDWRPAFIKFVECLRSNEVHCVFVYDGKPSADKDKELKRRKESRNKVEDRIFALREAINKFHNEYIVEPLLIQFQQRRKIKPPRLLGTNKQEINIKAIEVAVERMESQLAPLTDHDIKWTKSLLELLDVPWVQAPSEAETICSDLCKKDLVGAVLSRDTDVLAYGSPVLLTDITPTTGVSTRIVYKNVLKELDLTEAQFLDLCIMCGTDYNDNIFRVGPKKAYQFIQWHGDIDGITKKTHFDTTILRHHRVRELFTEYKTMDDIKIPYCGTPDFTELAVFLRRHNVNVPVEALRKAFTHSDNIVIIEDESSDEADEVELVIEDSDENTS